MNQCLKDKDTKNKCIKFTLVRNLIALRKASRYQECPADKTCIDCLFSLYVRNICCRLNKNYTMSFNLYKKSFQSDWFLIDFYFQWTDIRVNGISGTIKQVVPEGVNTLPQSSQSNSFSKRSSRPVRDLLEKLAFFKEKRCFAPAESRQRSGQVALYPQGNC